MGVCQLKKEPSSFNLIKLIPVINQTAKREIGFKYKLNSDKVLGMGHFGKVILATN